MRVSQLALLLVLVGCTPVEFTTQCSVAPETCCDLNPDHPACADVSTEAAVELDGAPHDAANDGLPADTTTGPDGEAPDVSGEDTASPDGTTADALLDSVVVDSTGIDTGATVDTGADSVTVDTNADTCPKNACGGCATLPNPLGSPCGICDSGKHVCNGTDAVSCSDPFTGTKPGIACGTCKTLVTKCAPDGKSASCPGDDANACGGCTALANAPGKSCGACSGGSYVCDGTNATKCNDPVTTAPGTKCGICMTSSFVCSGATTACAKPDDRTSGTESIATAAGSQIAYATSPAEPVGLSFTMPRAGSVTGLKLSLLTQLPMASEPVGTLRVRFIKGDPTLTPAAGDVLATGTIDPASLPTVTEAVQVVTFAATPHLLAGQHVWVEITDQSPRFEFPILGEATTGKADLAVWKVDGGALKKAGGLSPYLEVVINGCW